MPQQDQADATIPVYQESYAGALIDSARISVVVALSLVPPPAEESLIITPGARAEETPDWTTRECLEQAMQWLDAARAQTIVDGAPVTSLHVAAGGTPR